VNAGEFAKRRARIENNHDHRRKGHQAKAFAALVRQAKAIIAIAGGKVVGWRLPDGQMVCKKRRYTSAEKAALALSDVQAEPGKTYLPCRSYQCPYCHGWHLTHQSRENLS
jgi:hypothetical protein